MREKVIGATTKDVLSVSNEQVQKQKQSSQTEEEHAPEESKDIRNQELTDDVDEMLADIDEALGDLTEEETLEFVEGFVQKGGE